jgi:hypothetical protein
MTGINIDTYSPLCLGLTCDMILNFTQYIYFVNYLCNRTNKFYYMKDNVIYLFFSLRASVSSSPVCLTLFSNDQLFILLEIEHLAFWWNIEKIYKGAVDSGFFSFV